MQITLFQAHHIAHVNQHGLEQVQLRAHQLARYQANRLFPVNVNALTRSLYDQYHHFVNPVLRHLSQPHALQDHVMFQLYL